MTREEVKTIFPDATDEQVNAFLDKNSRDIGKAKGDGDKHKAEVERLKQQITEKDNTISEMEKAKGDADKIAAELEKYKQAEADRQAAEKAAEEDRILTEAVTSAIGDKEFVNDMTKNGYIAEVKKALADPANKGKGAAEIFESLTKDVEGIFKNPQQTKVTVPSASGAGNGQTFTREQIQNMSPKEINENWDNIKNSLKGL